MDSEELGKWRSGVRHGAEATTGRHVTKACRKFQKRRLRRLRRRTEKLDPSDAPRSLRGYIYGWAD